MRPGLFYLHTHLFGVLGTHSNLFRTSSHTQRGALGQIIGHVAFIPLWFSPLCDFVLFMFIWIPYLWLLYLYPSISITCTHTLSMCGCCLFRNLSLLCTHTHSLCVVVLSIPFYIYDTNTHTLVECSLPFYFYDTHTFCVCGWLFFLHTHTHTHTHTHNFVCKNKKPLNGGKKKGFKLLVATMLKTCDMHT